jgi:hypothetical protein
VSVFIVNLRESNGQRSYLWPCIKGEIGVLWVPCGVPCGCGYKHKYKGVAKLRTKIMEWSYIYRYISFGVGLLFLLGLIGFTWVTLRKIRQCPFWSVFWFIGTDVVLNRVMKWTNSWSMVGTAPWVLRPLSHCLRWSHVCPSFCVRPIVLTVRATLTVWGNSSHSRLIRGNPK